MLFVQSFRLLKRCYWRAGDEGVKGWRLYCVWKELIQVSDCARKERAVSVVPSARKTLLLQTVLRFRVTSGRPTHSVLLHCNRLVCMYRVGNLLDVFHCADLVCISALSYRVKSARQCT